MDGNNLLKLVDSYFHQGQQCSDRRSIQSDMWITLDEVDIYKDEVASVKAKVT
jgi:hypothetical protein